MAYVATRVSISCKRLFPSLLRLQFGLIPTDVLKAAELMNDGGDGLSGLGKVNAITPQYYVLGIKPLA